MESEQLIFGRKAILPSKHKQLSAELKIEREREQKLEEEERKHREEQKLKTKPTYTIIDDTESPKLLYGKKFGGVYKVFPIEKPFEYSNVPFVNASNIEKNKIVPPTFFKKDNQMIYYDQNSRYRENMEDYYTIFDYTEGRVYVVLDGHGGDTSAKYVASIVESVFTQMFEQNPEYISLIHDTFLFLNILLEGKFPNTHSGTTMTMVVHDKNHGKVYLANVGDSKAILFQGEEVLLATIDHRYNESTFENERINKIVKEGEDLVKELVKSDRRPQEISEILQEKQKDYRLFYNIKNKSYYIQKYEYNKKLDPSSNNQQTSQVKNAAQNTRSLGDFSFKGVIIPVPFVYEYDLDSLQDVYLLVASDGLWDYYSKVNNSPQLVVNRIQKENILNEPMKETDIGKNVFKLVYSGGLYIGDWTTDNIMIILDKLT